MGEARRRRLADNVLTDTGIRDIDEKHVVHCRAELDGMPTPQRCMLLWRTRGARGRSLPKIGERLTNPAMPGMVMNVEHIELPGSLTIDPEAATLVLTTQSAEPD